VKIRECEAWNAIMWAGGPAMPSPGGPQAGRRSRRPSTECNRFDRVSLVPLRALRHPPETPVWKLEAALYCEPCTEGSPLDAQAEPHSEPSQWLWFGAALLAMTVIAKIKNDERGK
jgi:hypothetical protein